MTPEIHRFLDLATRPLEGDPPLREEAKGELMARVGHAGVPFEMLDLAEPIARLEATPPEKPWRRRGALLAALFLSAGAVLGITAFLAYQITLSTMVSFLSYQRFTRSSSPSFENPLLLQHVERNAPGLPLGRRILAGGDGMKETAEALSRQPDDPAMLQEQVCRQMLKAGKEWTGLDENTKAGIARLDADNALWPLLQAFALMESCTDPMAHYRSHRSSATPAIKDEAQFQNVLRLFSEAAANPRYQDRSWSLVRRQIDAFRPAQSFYDDLLAQGFTGFVTRPFTGNFGFLGNRFAVMASVRCDRLVTAKDQDGLRAFLGEWRNVARLFLESPEPVERDTAMLLSELKTMGEILAQSCKNLGMTAEEAAARETMARLPDQSYVYHPYPPELRKAAGVRLESYNNRGLEGLTVEEVLPSRKTELAFFDRHVAISLALIGMVFSGLVGLEACRRSKLVKGTAKGLMPLFRREDHCWIAGLGLAVPWLWWWVVTRLTPLGLHGADPNELDVGMIALMIQPAAALVLAMVMLLQTARWRWEVRGGFLALGGFFPKLGWIAAGLTALAIPAAGGIIFLTHLRGDDKALFMLGVSCMGSFGLLWLLWEGIMNLFTPRASALRPNLVMRVLLPWTFAGIFSLIAAFGVSTFMERRWFAKDPLLPSWTSKTHRNAFEERRAERWLKP
jgi:hypothetical protein